MNDSLKKLLGIIVGDKNFRSLKILLKPNLISARISSLACTEGSFIRAVAILFRDLGAHVTVGDSPAFGSARSVLDKIGVLQDLLRLDIAVDNFTRIERVTLPSGTKVGLAAQAGNCDLLVNLPRIKAHAQLLVTMAVKNYFGCVCGLRKPYWHMRYGGTKGSFEHHLVELLSVLPDTLVLADGIRTMHQTGPIGGNPYDLGVTACSTNPVALDRSMLDILSIDPQKSPLMQACMEQEAPGADIKTLDFPLRSPAELRVNDFSVPGFLQPVRFRPIRYMKSNIKRIVMFRGCGL